MNGSGDPDLPNRLAIGRWLGSAHDITQGMAYHVLTSKGTVITRSTVHKLSEVEHLSEDMMRMKNDFTKSIESTIGNYMLSNVDNNVDVYEQLFEDFIYDKVDIKNDFSDKKVTNDKI